MEQTDPKTLTKIRNNDLKKDKKDNRTLNSLIKQINVVTNQELEEDLRSERAAPALVLIAPPLAVALVTLSATVTAAATVAIGVAAFNTVDPSGSKKSRDVKIQIKTTKWAILFLRIGFVENTIILPPVDIDVDLKVNMFNEDSRRTAVIVEYITIGDKEELVKLSELSEEELKNSGAGIASLNQTFVDSDFYLKIDDTKFLAEVLLSGDTNDIFAIN
ncbi:hypothetical protein [Candidatus Uabimicrobium sp. HlEnr_7]|uniref:hypothetical protein n=1 Tax=Candidatus Uabimicrobium helgolandensis TaxID=3095367 RepID=UPI0035567924